MLTQPTSAAVHDGGTPTRRNAMLYFRSFTTYHSRFDNVTDGTSKTLSFSFGDGSVRF